MPPTRPMVAITMLFRSERITIGNAAPPFSPASSGAYLDCAAVLIAACAAAFAASTCCSVALPSPSR